MTRQDVLKEYQVNDKGIITNKGKFEGEKLYVPYFFDAVMNGFSDEIGESLDIFILTKEDKTEFPELKDVFAVVLEHSDNGFVYGKTMTEKQIEQLRNELENLESEL